MEVFGVYRIMDTAKFRDIDIIFLHALLDSAPVWNSTEETRARHKRWLDQFQSELTQRKLKAVSVGDDLKHQTPRVTLADITDDFRDAFNVLVEEYGEEYALEILQEAHDEVQDPPKLGFQWDLTELNDDDLIFWEGVAAEIIDFSCLGRGVRDTLYPVWDLLRGAVEGRGLKSAGCLFEI